LETSKKEEITISGNKDQTKEVKTTVTTTTTTVTSTAPKEEEKEEKKEESTTQVEKEEKKEQAQQPQQQNFSYFPMFMYPGQGGNTQMPMAMPMAMPMTSKEGDKTAPQQPFICMMPVCFCDPSKMPKDMKFPTGGNMPSMPFYFPYPMAPQNNPESK